MAKTKTKAALEVPKIDGLNYFRTMQRMHKILKPEWYLEIGTFSGKSLRLARCNTVAVDPNFLIKFDVINPTGKEMHFMQMTSDAFFESRFMAKNDLTFDLAFLDGLHHYEALLRDFINTEKCMAKDGVILLHDCCPSTDEMTGREQTKGAWTGDVWKTLLILKKHRPKLDIMVANSHPTGLVVIRNLDPKDKTLGKAFDKITAEYDDLHISDLEGGVAGLYQQFELLTPEEMLIQLGK